MAAAPDRGTVYLIHFDFPYRARTGAQRHQVCHYLGWASDLDARIHEHRASRGARLMEIVNDARIPWSVVRTWEGDRRLERKLKNRKRASAFCPICRAAVEAARAKAAADAESQLSLF